MTQGTIQLNGSVTSINLDAKQFKTGSTGFYGSGKLMAPDGKYQIAITVVKIGSKKQQ